MEARPFPLGPWGDEWLREQGFNPDDILLFDDSVPLYERERRDANARYATLVLWIELFSEEGLLNQSL